MNYMKLGSNKKTEPYILSAKVNVESIYSMACKKVK